MSKFEILVREIIECLLEFSAQEIEGIRTEWMKTVRETDKKANKELIEKVVNYTCDFAVNEVSQRIA